MTDMNAPRPGSEAAFMGSAQNAPLQTNTLDFTPPAADQPPSLVTQMVAAVTRHGLTVLAGVLGERGILSSDQQTQFVGIGGAIVTAGLALTWSFYQKHTSAKKV